MNGYLWRVMYVDPESNYLIDRTGSLTLATTDPDTLCVYISNELQGDFLIRVLVHEIGHCALFSFDLLGEIHKVVDPYYWIEAEEWVCNFIADYGLKIFSVARSILGDNAWVFIPYELERLIA